MPNKKLGQHWLRDAQALNGIVDIADIEPDDTVLEIGPGLGTLTELLAKKCKRLVCVEFDAALIAGLEEKFSQQPHVSIVLDDIRSFDPSGLEPNYKIVANIPYYLTSALIRRFSIIDNLPASMTLLIQKEVAERVAAKPGKLSILGVSAQLYHEIQLGAVVPANLFEPAPQVDSQVVHLVRRTKPLFAANNEAVMKTVKAGFAEKRKKLANSLSGSLQIDKSEVEAQLAELGMNKNVRAQEVSLEEWAEITSILAV